MAIDVMQAVVAELNRRGLDAHVEYPGHIEVTITRTNYHAYGDANGETFSGDNMDNGECIEVFESTIPCDSTDVQTIADFIACNVPLEVRAQPVVAVLDNGPDVIGEIGGVERR